MSIEFTRNHTVLGGNVIFTFSFFFRVNSPNLAQLVHAAPSLREQQSIPATAPWRITQVACSTGEETWSLAAGLLHQGVRPQIHAYDINPVLVEEARRARYACTLSQLILSLESWDLPPKCTTYFEAVDDGHIRPTPALQTCADFLVSDARNDALAPADVVVANHLLGYFVRQPDLPRLVGNLAACLEPGGILTLDDAHRGDIQEVLEGHNFTRMVDAAGMPMPFYQLQSASAGTT